MVKAFGQAMKDIPSNVHKHFQDAVNAVNKVLADPNATATDYREAFETVERAFKDACTETGTTASDAAREEFEQHVYKSLNPDAIQRWGAEKLKSVADLAEQVRPVLPKFWTATKLAWTATIAVAVSVGATAVRVVTAPHHPAPAAQPSPIAPPPVVGVDFPSAIPDRSPLPTELTLRGDQFDVLASRLDISPYSLAALGRERVDLDTSDLPPVTMPPWMAAAAAAPVAVSTRQGDATYTDTTTVQKLYESLPEARDQVEEQVRYNGGEGLHVDITVESDFASIHIGK